MTPKKSLVCGMLTGAGIEVLTEILLPGIFENPNIKIGTYSLTSAFGWGIGLKWAEYLLSDEQYICKNALAFFLGNVIGMAGYEVLSGYS